MAAEDYAMLVSGKDEYGHFIHVPPPAEDLSEEAIRWHERILSAQNEAMYDGARQG